MNSQSGKSNYRQTLIIRLKFIKDWAGYPKADPEDYAREMIRFLSNNDRYIDRAT